MFCWRSSQKREQLVCTFAGWQNGAHLVRIFFFNATFGSRISTAALIYVFTNNLLTFVMALDIKRDQNHIA